MQNMQIHFDFRVIEIKTYMETIQEDIFLNVLIEELKSV